MTQQIFSNRYFSERNRLIFEYPSENGDNTIVFIPFYENPQISEDQNANFAEYNPIGRAGSLYAYTGASSRKFKVSFNLTLPHLAYHPMGVNRFLRVYQGSSKESQKLLFTKNSNFSAKQLPGDPNKSLSLAVEKAFRQLQLDNGNFVMPDLPSIPGITRPSTTTEELQSSYLNTLSATERHKVLDTLLFFVAILRTSVTNNVSNPLLGPPLVRIDFGTLYQQVPCICESFRIAYKEEGGYDLPTTTPRLITISLSLKEVRAGDFTEYQPAVLSKRDNLTGWESAINSPHTIDPLVAGGYWAGGL